MIPMMLKFKIPRPDKPALNLYFPVFIIWLLVGLILLLLLPLLLLASFLTWSRGYGPTLLYLYPLVFSVLWNLHGLQIDVQDKSHHIHFSFF